MNKPTFPVGFHQLHPDVSMNFQMNRWFSWVGEPSMLDEMRKAAPRIATYVDWKREFLALAESAVSQGHVLRTGFYFRAAEFFMPADDPDRRNAREQFLRAMRTVYGLDQFGPHDVPYTGDGAKGMLPEYHFAANGYKGFKIYGHLGLLDASHI